MRLDEVVDLRVADHVEDIINDTIESYSSGSLPLNQFLSNIQTKIAYILKTYLKKKYNKDITIVIKYHSKSNLPKASVVPYENKYYLDIFIETPNIAELLTYYKDNPTLIQKQVKQKNLFHIDSLIHELEHIEQFIKTNVNDQPSFDKKFAATNKNGKELLDYLIYYSRKYEIDAFTTQIAFMMLKRYDHEQIKGWLRHLHKIDFTIDHAKSYSEYLPEILISLKYAFVNQYKDLDSKSQSKDLRRKLDRAYLNLIKKIYKKVEVNL